MGDHTMCVSIKQVKDAIKHEALEPLTKLVKEEISDIEKSVNSKMDTLEVEVRHKTELLQRELVNRNELINQKLDTISKFSESSDAHLRKINGTIGRQGDDITILKRDYAVHKHDNDKSVEFRKATCPVKDDINNYIKTTHRDLNERLTTLEEGRKVWIGKKQILWSVIVLIGMLLGMAVSIVTINKNISKQNMETVIKKIIEENYNN
jgi:hypothetical protein